MDKKNKIKIEIKDPEETLLSEIKRLKIQIKEYNILLKLLREQRKIITNNKN